MWKQARGPMCGRKLVHVGQPPRLSDGPALSGRNVHAPQRDSTLSPRPALSWQRSKNAFTGMSEMETFRQLCCLWIHGMGLIPSS